MPTVSYYMELRRLEGTELHRARAPSVCFLVKQALRCQLAEELGERLRRRHQRRKGSRQY